MLMLLKNPIKRLVRLGCIHGYFRNRYVESREIMLEGYQT